VGLPKNQKENYTAIRKQIAAHGTQEVEELITLPDGQQKSVTGTRTLLVLEMLYRKAVQEKNMNAAQQYLDRILGRPKESLSISDDSEGIGKLTDDQLIEKIATVIKATGKAGARKSD